jgi:MATE family multidrug resistance protein
MFFGLNGALETLVSQAYGAKDLRLCGIYLNRGRFINTLVFLFPISLCFLFSGKALKAFGQD